jgi:hypothetical protein
LYTDISQIEDVGSIGYTYALIFTSVSLVVGTLAGTQSLTSKYDLMTAFRWYYSALLVVVRDKLINKVIASTAAIGLCITLLAGWY